MKKQYKKPDILFDSFELSQSIAAACAYISNQERTICPVDIGGSMSLFSELGVCTLTPPAGDNTVCYDVPSLDSKIFGS